MSENILVRGHMRFADDSDTDDSDTANPEEDPCKISDHDFFHRFSNKVYAFLIANL